MNLHDDTKIREGEFRAILGIKNFLENHSEWLSYHVRSVKKRNQMYLHTLSKMAEDRDFRDAVIIGDVDGWLYSDEKGWVRQ